MKVVIIPQDDVLPNDRTKYNSNNHYSDTVTVEEYCEKIKSTHIHSWIHLKEDYMVITIPIEKWFWEATKIGEVTGKFPDLFKDE